MKQYFSVIKYSAVFLLLFPFLGLPESWEYLYVVFFAFLIGISILIIQKKIGVVQRKSEDKSLQNYINELKERFKHHEFTQQQSEEKSFSSVNSISRNNNVISHSEEEKL